MTISDKLDPATAIKILFFLLAYAGLVLIWRGLSRRLTRRVKDRQARYRLRKAVQLSGYVLGALLIILIASAQSTYWSVAIGLVGAAVAYALQDVILSIAGWSTIHLLSVFKPGDRIEVLGMRGDVIDINLLQTTLMEIGEWVDGDLYTGRMIRLGNNQIFKGPVKNYSSDFPFLWDEVKVPVRYGSDLQRAREILLQAAEEVVSDYARLSRAEWEEVKLRYLVEDARTEALVSMVANDNYLLFTLRYTVDYRQRRNTADQLYAVIAAAIAADESVWMASATIEVQMGAPAGG